MEQQEILIRSSIDGTAQPSLFYRSASVQPRPLLVGLHTWSFDRFNQIEVMLPWAEKLDFHLLLPEFRGPNLSDNPRCTEACGSALAQQDIKDAVEYVLQNENVDRDHVFLLGLSGGGYMALMMASACPEIFRAIGSYVPITDLNRWAKENAYYTDHILACCSHSQQEMARRSPINHLDEIARANLKLFHGKYDSTVPVGHSIDFFNRMTSKHPEARVYLDVFDGGHEIDMETAVYWLLSQCAEKHKVQVTG